MFTLTCIIVTQKHIFGDFSLGVACLGLVFQDRATRDLINGTDHTLRNTPCTARGPTIEVVIFNDAREIHSIEGNDVTSHSSK